MATVERSQRARRIARRVLALLATLVALLVSAEAALRVWKPFPRDAPWYPDDHVPVAQSKDSTLIDPALGWRFQPNAVIDDPSPDFHVTYDCNEEGFRVTPARAASEDEIRVVFLGDSFTFGYGVEEGELFAARTAEARPDLRVFNYGMGGYGVDQMWRALVEFGLARRPHVVVATFVIDDLNRGLTAFRDRDGWRAKPTFAVEDGRLVPRTRENSPGRLVRWLEREPYLAEAWRRVENKLGLAYGFGRRFELNRELFRAMRDTCNTAECTLVVVHLPQRGAWRPVPSFAEAFRELGILFVDLGAVAVGDPASLFFARDPHIDADGHRFVASELSRFLLEHGLFDRVAR